ncbi:hypothetical protein [Herbiconiux sp. UC225_62]|uniref:DUF7620 family protein n=1 Tax=Herbiconiux sp. UC225_62 TaxID=3350168 RepID=UPI0036D325E9
MWWRKKPPVPIPDDVNEAIELREQTNAELSRVRAQDPYVSRLSSRLVERRALNHFGDDIQVTFTPRGRHAG